MKLRRLLPLVVLFAGFGVAWLVLLVVARLYEDEGENYSLIEPGLYMGGDVARPPRGTQAVLNLCEKEDPYSVEVALWEPIRDAEPAPDLAWLRRMVEFIDANRSDGKTTFVHCRNGVSRSGLVVVAYVMMKNGWSRDRALEFVRAGRPIARPNPAFMRLLLEWERAVTEEGQ
jgi:hypothetical protein